MKQKHSPNMRHAFLYMQPAIGRELLAHVCRWKTGTQNKETQRHWREGVSHSVSDRTSVQTRNTGRMSALSTLTVHRLSSVTVPAGCSQCKNDSSAEQDEA